MNDRVPPHGLLYMHVVLLLVTAVGAIPICRERENYTYVK